MNKRNFGAVIKRIEANPELHAQGRDPCNADIKCGYPYCFIGHAEFIRTKGKKIKPLSGFISDVSDWRSDDPLLKWLGLSPQEAHSIYWATSADIARFKRWHKAGCVS